LKGKLKMKELLKDLLIAWINRPKKTSDAIEADVWAFVVKSITVMVLGIAFGVLWLIGFEKQDEVLAPIDGVFLEILKAIAFMGVGAMGAISGRKGTTPDKEQS
jgi:hypothetical protein